jgi:DNA replication ATP-dependent helicase Dna2
LSTFKRAFVERIEKDPKKQETILTLKHETSEQKAQCRLQVPWNYSRVAENQLVSVQGIWSEKDQCYAVSKDAGVLVTFPDTLISGTSVVGSLFCSRKALLSTKFMGIDTNSKIVSSSFQFH